MVRSAGSDAVFDLCHIGDLEHQPAKMVELVSRSERGERGQITRRSRILFALEPVGTSLGGLEKSDQQRGSLRHFLMHGIGPLDWESAPESTSMPRAGPSCRANHSTPSANIYVQLVVSCCGVEPYEHDQPISKRWIGITNVEQGMSNPEVWKDFAAM